MVLTSVDNVLGLANCHRSAQGSESAIALFYLCFMFNEW